MKAPIWESSPGALMNNLLFPTTVGTPRQFAYFDLYTFSTIGGPVLRYTTADMDISYTDSLGVLNVWTSKQVRIGSTQNRALAHWKVGLDVDSWQIEIFPRSVDDLTGATYPDLIGSVPWLAALRAGALDAARVTVDRAFFPLPLVPLFGGTVIQPLGVLRLFAGRVAEADCSRSGAVLTFNSHLDLLNTLMPHNLYQSSCSHVLFDSGCQLDKNAFATSHTILVNFDSNKMFRIAFFTVPGNTLTFGRAVFTSGQNNGFSRGIRGENANPAPGFMDILLNAPAPFTMQPGDTVTLYPGCDKSTAACSVDFNNLINFGGEPFIPAPEVAV